MCSILRGWCTAGGALRREMEGTKEMGIGASLRWVVTERMACERGMGQRDEGRRRDGRWSARSGVGRDGDGDGWLALRSFIGFCSLPSSLPPDVDVCSCCVLNLSPPPPHRLAFHRTDVI
ncbi:hypothetical protein MRB53_025864 [Persea americana]|uniref:Uncharacterized protein n=1 Tax=Persea americana TaxID=3435 RepID=A0ACC2LGR3_PERAE|nr:hypothetical protein MRB53_025864 [Persea americana]